MMDLIVNPPTLENASQETVENYTNEKLDILNSLKRRALSITEALNNMKNITCNPIDAAMYAFP